MFFSVERDCVWGDYGEFLIHGDGYRGSHTHYSQSGPLNLARTGPYIPRVTIPEMTIVISDDARRDIDSKGHNYGFSPVNKCRISRLEWHNWDLDAARPKFIPHGGEPSSYIGTHCPETAAEMGDVWELDLARGATVSFRDTGPMPWDSEMEMDRKSWNGDDLFFANQNQNDISKWPIATETGKDLLQAIGGGQWLKFVPIQLIG